MKTYIERIISQFFILLHAAITSWPDVLTAIACCCCRSFQGPFPFGMIKDVM
jgi:hypothetical protein